jgi:site-specific DNA recombinase
VETVIYLRQSLDRDGTRAAVDRQRTVCRDLAQRRGWTVRGEYVDNDVSASSGKVRPAYRRMLDAAERGELRGTAVIAYHPDRLARRMIDFEDLIVRSQRDGFTVATVTGDLDLTNDMGRLVGRILASVASAEVERKGARQKLAASARAQAGRPVAGRRAIGFEPDGITIRAREADLIRAAYPVVLAGGSISGVARTWNAGGLRTVTGECWGPDTVRKLLVRSRYAGIRSYNGEEMGRAVWDPIVDESTFRGVVAMLNDPSRRLSHDNARRYLLSGLARCGLCGGVVSTGRSSRGARTYLCGTHKHLSVAAERIDDRVLDVIAARLSRADAADLLVAPSTGPDTDSLRVEAMALKARLDELATLFAAGTITGSQLTTGTEALRHKLDAAHAAMADAARMDVLGDVVGTDDVRSAIESLSLDRRRAIVDMMLSVTLHSPGRGVKTFRPDTVEPTWKV